MKANRLALAISRGTFLMDPRYIVGLSPIVNDFMDGKPVSFFGAAEEEMEGPQVAYMIADSYRFDKVALDDTANIFASYPKGSIAIIPVEGVIMMDDYCGAPGTNTLSQWLKDARDSSNITAVIFKINSGGGMVSGTKEFSDLISSVDKVKPVYAYSVGMMASAAYWIACACREIYVSSETVEIGSIGTAYKFSDNREAMKKYGVTGHYVNADTSPHKNMTTLKALDGNYTDLKALLLNPTNDVFLKAVKSNRGDKLELKEVDINGVIHHEPLTGHVYLAETAQSLGLIDGIKTLEELVLEASTTNDKKATNRYNHMKFSLLSGLINKAANTVTPEELKLVNEELSAAGINFSLTSEEALQSLNAELEQAKTALTEAQGNLSTTKESLTASEAKVTGLEEKVNNLTTAKTEVDGALSTANTRIAELEAKIPGEKKGKAISKGDTTHTGGDKPLRSWEQKALQKVGGIKE